MKRFLRFEGYDYYPSGGWGDFVGDYDTLEEARAVERQLWGWLHIVDTETMKVEEDLK